MSDGSREAGYARILAEARGISVAWLSAVEIDHAAGADGFDRCHQELLRRTVEALVPQPDLVLVDHFDVPGLRVPQQAITHGEDASTAIAAASIVAKVTRDRIMTDLHRLLPAWGFDVHKGYGGGDGRHEAALFLHGASPVHRLSSKGVKRALALRDQTPPSDDP
jgi:ribonuclease HII